MSSKRAHPSRRDLSIMWFGVMGVYTLTVGIRASPVADAVFACVAVVVCNWAGAWLISAAPLLLVPAGLLHMGPALVSTALLLVGPVAMLALVAIVELPFYLRRSAAPGLERIAAMQVIANPVRRGAAVAVAIAALAQYGVEGLAAIVLPAIALWRASWIWCAALSVGAAALTAWSWPPLLFAGLSVAMMAWTHLARPPELAHPFPPLRVIDGPLAWLRAHRFERRVRQGDLIGARSVLKSSRRASPDDLLRQAFLDVEERSYQTALSLDRSASGRSRQFELCRSLIYARALSGIGRFADARAIYCELLDERSAWKSLDPYVRVLLAENELAAGDIGPARAHAQEAFEGCADSKDDYFLRLRACCVLAECAIDDTADAVGFEARLETIHNALLSNRWIAHMAVTSDRAKLVRELFGNRGSLHQHFVRVDTLTSRGGKMEDSVGWDPEAVAVGLAIAGWSDDLVELLLMQARRAAEDDEQVDRVRLAARALMELDRTRYRLAAQSSRTSWSRRFQRVLAVALDAAHETQDHTFVAELLEFARVQALPAATAEAAGDLPLSTPPVIRLRGHSRLARPGEPDRPDPVTLETATERAAGVGGWWLSYWEVSDWLYWALVPPDGADIHSGRVSIGPASDLSRELAALRDSLPVLQPDEDVATADFRIARSPLMSDPSAERRLSARLGLQLLPTQLLAAARGYQLEERRLSISIAPSPSLGYVPWSLLATPRADGRYDRLLELCDWTLVPSAALLAGATVGPSAGRAPLALAVADTASTANLGDLPGARAQAGELPPSVTVLGARHWTRAVATIETFERELRQLGPAITVAFLCHAVRGTSEEPSRGGLVMAPSDPEAEFAILDAASLFAMGARGLEMPAQVLLQACDTSALSDAQSGEWLTLAPALLAGGSREVLATLYPVPDIASVDDPIFQAAIAGESLCEAAAQMQRTNLTHWESGKATDLSHTPLFWAGYAPLRVRNVPCRDDEACGGGAQLVSARFVKVIAKAIRSACEGHARQMHSGYLLSAVLDDTGIAELFDGASTSLRPTTFVWTLGPHICSRFLRMRDGRGRDLTHEGTLGIEVSETLIDGLAAARTMASKDGVMIEPEHLLQACLTKASAARRILRFLSTVTRRHMELTERAIGHALAEAIARSQEAPREVTDHASPEERLARSFAALELDQPHTRPAAPPANSKPLTPASAQTFDAAAAAAETACETDSTPAHTSTVRAEAAVRTRLSELETVAPGVAGMLERLADDARDALGRAIDAARELHHERVGTGHLLLGLLDSDGTSVSQALARVGIDSESVRARVIDSVTPTRPASTSIAFSRTVKRALELALRESLKSHATRVSAEHILLALMRQEDSLARRIMRDLGASCSALSLALERSAEVY